MKVADVMASFVEFIGADATVQQAAEMMGELDVGALPVGSEDRLEGILTDRDILYRVVASGLDSTTTRVRDVMSTLVFSCREDDSLDASMEIMGEHSIRRLPVLDAEGRATGWLTLADVSRKLLLESGIMQRALQEIGKAQDSDAPEPQAAGDA